MVQCNARLLPVPIITDNEAPHPCPSPAVGTYDVLLPDPTLPQLLTSHKVADLCLTHLNMLLYLGPGQAMVRPVGVPQDQHSELYDYMHGDPTDLEKAYYLLRILEGKHYHTDINEGEVWPLLRDWLDHMDEVRRPILKAPPNPW